MTASPPLVSILVPVYNGADLVADLHRALAPVLDAMQGGAEIVFIDDGSTDGTIAALAALQRTDPRVRIIELATNFGQHAAFSAGFDLARGRYLVTMDADLQCDPTDIPKLLAPLEAGYDFVSGVRTERHDPLLRRLPSRLVTWLVARMAGVRLRDIGCPFNACSVDVARRVGAFGELRRFLKPLVVRLARRVTEVEVAHRPRSRARPRSSYSATALVRLFMDFFVTSLSDVFAWLFVLAAGLTTIVAAAAVVTGIGWMAGGAPGSLAGSLAGIAAVLALVALFGVLGDYVQRIYRQTSGRPFYMVRRVIEAVDDPPGAGGARGH